MADTFNSTVLNTLTWLRDTSIRTTGARGSLGGYSTPEASNSITITRDSKDDIVASSGTATIAVPNGNAGECWLKTVSVVDPSVTPGPFGDKWNLPGGEIPEMGANCVMSLYWNGTYGIVNVTYGEDGGALVPSGGGGSSTNYLPLTGGTMTGNITFGTGSQYSIGSASKKLKSLYVDELYLSQNSLYLGDTKVLGTTDSTVVVKTDVGQDLKLQTSGADDDISVVTQGNGADISFTAGGAGSKISFNAPSIDFTSTTLELKGATSISVTAPSIDFTGAVTVSDLTVNGTTTTVNTTDLNVKDNLIVLNNGETGAGVSKGTAGIEIHRGTAARYRLVFDESDDKLKAGIVDSNGNNTTLKKVLFEGDVDIPDTSSFVTEQDLVDTIESMLSESGIGGDEPPADGDPSAGTAPVNVTNIYNELQLLAYYSGASAGNNTVAGETTKEVRIVAHSAPDAVNDAGQNSKWDTAGLYLYGRDLLFVNGTADTGNAGKFKLQTIYNSSNVQHSLTGAPDGKLTWTGTVQAQDYVLTSDRRMKENLVEIDSCLDKVDALTPYTFNFINDAEKVRKAGVIAQDVEKVLPEAVTEDEGVKRVSYDSLIPLLIGAIKELKAENEELRKMIAK